MNQPLESAAKNDATEPRAWVSPAIEDLPRLVDITLQTGDVIPGGINLPSGAGFGL